MNKFNITRIRKILEWDFSTNKHNYLLTMAGILIFFLIIFVGGEAGTIYYYNMGIRPSADIPMTITWAFAAFSLFSIIFASNILVPMKSKNNKIAFMMLPSSKLERYIERVILVGIIAPIYMFICILIADLMRFFVGIIFLPNDLVELNFSEIINDGLLSSPVMQLFPTNITLLSAASGILYYISNTCWFILGGTIWQKHAFLKTFIATAILAFIVIIPLVIIGTASNFNLAGNVEHTSKATLSTNANTFYCIYCFVISIVSIILSYRVYLRKQVNS